MHECHPIPIPGNPAKKLTIAMCPTSPKEQEAMRDVPYRQVLGSLCYLVTCTRPDLCFITGMLSRFMQNPGQHHWQALKRVLRYLKHTLALGISYWQEANASPILTLAGLIPIGVEMLTHGCPLLVSFSPLSEEQYHGNQGSKAQLLYHQPKLSL